MKAMDENPMKSICEAFRDGSLSHSKSEDIFKQLQVEGKRRIDAFVFEQMFKYRLKSIANAASGFTLSFGWHIGYNKYGDPSFWFRLMDAEEEWNSCDAAMTCRLEGCKVGRYGRPVKVFKTRFDVSQNGFIAAEWLKSGWGDWCALSTIIDALANRGQPREPLPMKNVAPASASIAFDWLYESDLKWELEALSVQRRFMNCELGPRLGRDGTDIDALVLTADSQLRWLEFKRKYPATGENRFFGLDVRPHYRTVETITSLEINALHVILVAPVWEKNASPVAWLEVKDLEKHWTWLAVNLDGDAFDTPVLHTSGSDSGHRAALRDQVCIRWERVRLLNKGLSLGANGATRLLEFLRNCSLDNEPAMTFDELYSYRCVDHAANLQSRRSTSS